MRSGTTAMTGTRTNIRDNRAPFFGGNGGGWGGRFGIRRYRHWPTMANVSAVKTHEVAMKPS